MGGNTANALILFSDDFESGAIDSSKWMLENNRGASWYYNPNGYISVQQVGGSPYHQSNRQTDIWTIRNDFSDFTLTYDIRFNNEYAHNVFRTTYLRGSPYNVSTGVQMNGYTAYATLGYNWIPQNDSASIDLIDYASNPTVHNSLAHDVNTDFEVEEWYTFKLEANGDNLKYKFWKRNEAEVSDWLFDVIDSSSYFPEGNIGFGSYWNALTDIDNIVVESSAIPEPATITLLGLGLMGLTGLTRNNATNKRK